MVELIQVNRSSLPLTYVIICLLDVSSLKRFRLQVTLTFIRTKMVNIGAMVP